VLQTELCAPQFAINRRKLGDFLRRANHTFTAKPGVSSRKSAQKSLSFATEKWDPRRGAKVNRQRRGPPVSELHLHHDPKFQHLHEGPAAQPGDLSSGTSCRDGTGSSGERRLASMERAAFRAVTAAALKEFFSSTTNRTAFRLNSSVNRRRRDYVSCFGSFVFRTSYRDHYPAPAAARKF
jgi:hypothetical protein